MQAGFAVLTKLSIKAHLSMVDEEHSESHVSFVDYEVSWQENGGSYLEGQVSQERIAD